METYLELLKEIEKFLKERSLKILLIWKILGLVFLGFFFTTVYVFCSSTGALVVSILGLAVLILLWMLVNQHFLRRSETCLDNVRILNFLWLLRSYSTDSVLFDIFEIRAGGNSRNKAKDLERIKNLIQTEEVKMKLEEYMRTHNITLNDGERPSIWD